MSKLIDNTYGSDQDGLVWGYRFAPGETARPIGTDAVADVLAEQEAPGVFLWLHFSLSNQASMRYMQRALPLSDAFFQSLHDASTSTRLEQDGSALVAVIHDVLFDAALDTSEIGTTTLFIGPRLFVSARRRPLRSIEQLRGAIRSGRMLRSPASMLAQLLQDQAGVLEDILRKSGSEVDRIEDQLLAARLTTNRSQLGTLHRALVRLQRVMAPEPTSLFRLLNRPPSWIDETDLQALRQSAEEFSTVIGDLMALVERIRLIQEELSALINEQSNRTLFVLTVFTVLALPINLIAGLFGMNVGGIPFSGESHGFVIVSVTVVSLTALLGYLAFWRRRD